MRTSDQIDQIGSALAAAQCDIPAIPKTKTAKIKGVSRKTGEAYEMGYKYADIADVLEKALPTLSKHNISVVQPTSIEQSFVTIHTRLIHASGQWIEGEYPVCATGADHQQMGAAMTYARRYALCAMLGIAAEEDTDGQGAADADARKPSTIASKRPPEPAVSKEAIVMGRRFTSCEAMTDIEDLRRSDDFLSFWKTAHKVDKDHITAAAERRKAALQAKYDEADVLHPEDFRMAG